jgi:MFS family permease
MIFVALSTTGLLGAIEATIISTALPTIVHNLNVGNNYAWIANAYFLTRLVGISQRLDGYADFNM